MHSSTARYIPLYLTRVQDLQLFSRPFSEQHRCGKGEKKILGTSQHYRWSAPDVVAAQRVTNDGMGFAGLVYSCRAVPCRAVLLAVVRRLGWGWQHRRELGGFYFGAQPLRTLSLNETLPRSATDRGEVDPSGQRCVSGGMMPGNTVLMTSDHPRAV